MPQSLAKIYIHLIFSTKNCEPLLRKDDLSELYRYIGGALNDISCPVVIVGGTTDHTHILFILNRTSTVADVAEQVKRSSSKWLKVRWSYYNAFAWQGGYGAFSVSQSKVDTVRRYIEHQEEHHMKLSFKDELRTFLHEYGVDYNEAYL